jgi:hypothetical protein
MAGFQVFEEIFGQDPSETTKNVIRRDFNDEAAAKEPAGMCADHHEHALNRKTVDMPWTVEEDGQGFWITYVSTGWTKARFTWEAMP